MRFKPKRDRIPELNLVPMLDVLMTVLTFFIVISMVLTAEKGVDVALTGGRNQPAPNPNEPLPEPMIVTLNPAGQLLINQQPIDVDRLAPAIQTYLDQNEKGAVLLQADRSLPYEQVVGVLGQMRDIGGSRISLALEETAASVEPAAPAAPATAQPATSAAPVANEAQAAPTAEAVPQPGDNWR